MNISWKTLIAACLVGIGIDCDPFKAESPQLCIVSPDHPETWDVDYNPKLDQRLWWSDKDRVLVAMVSYSRVSSSQVSVQAVNCHTFYLTFPQVGLDFKNRIYVLNQKQEKIIIGYRKAGAFGKQINLDDNVELSAHRKQGEMLGMLIAKDASKLKHLTDERKVVSSP